MAISVELGAPLETVVEGLLRGGRYNSKSEILREGVRLVQEREAKLAALDAAVTAGVADADAGRVKPLNEVFERLANRYKVQQ